MSCPGPSECLCQGCTLYDFLSNENNRKLYNKVIDLTRKYHHLKANSWHLKNCIDAKVVPPYFKVKTKVHDGGSEAAIETSLGWMRNIVEKNEKTENDILEEMAQPFNLLLNIIPDHLKQDLEDQVQRRGFGFQKHFREQKLRRLDKLISPPTKKEQKSQKNSKNTENTNNKKKRKWVKRSQYQRTHSHNPWI